MPNALNRLTLAGTAYHQLPGQNPFAVPLRATMVLNTPEQVYSRTPPEGIGNDWAPLSIGWLDRASVIYLKNNGIAGEGSLELGYYPEGDLRQIPAKIPLCVPPGMMAMLFPTGPLAIRCDPGQTKASYTVYAIPE